MFCHVSEAQGACSGARSGMTPSLRAGAPGIPPCSGACLSSAQVLPFNPVPLLPQARGGSHFRAYRARPCGRAGASCAGAVRAPDCARETADARLPSAPAGVFCGPSRSPAQKSRKAAPGAASLFSFYHTFPPVKPPANSIAKPRPRDYPVRIDRAWLPAYVGHPAARWESGYPSDCKSAYTGSNPVRASRALAKPGKGRYKGARSGLFRGSSVAERSAVNRLVVGSNPTRGATFFLFFNSLGGMNTKTGPVYRCFHPKPSGSTSRSTMSRISGPKRKSPIVFASTSGAVAAARISEDATST